VFDLSRVTLGGEAAKSCDRWTIGLIVLEGWDALSSRNMNERRVLD